MRRLKLDSADCHTLCLYLRDDVLTEHDHLVKQTNDPVAQPHNASLFSKHAPRIVVSLTAYIYSSRRCLRLMFVLKSADAAAIIVFVIACFRDAVPYLLHLLMLISYLFARAGSILVKV